MGYLHTNWFYDPFTQASYIDRLYDHAYSSFRNAEHALTNRKVMQGSQEQTDIIIIRVDLCQNETTGDIRHVHTRSQQLPYL